VREVLNQCLKEHAPHVQGEVFEVDRKDDRKPWSFALLNSELAAKELVKLSKEKKVILRGERLGLELSNYNTASLSSIDGNNGRSQWHSDRGDRSERKGKGGSKGEKGEKGGWSSRERGGKGWKGQS